MELFNKVSAFAKSAAKDLTGATKSLGDAANDTIETAKLNAKLIPEKKGLDAQLKKLGEYYYEKHKNGEELEEGVQSFAQVRMLTRSGLKNWKNSSQRLKKPKSCGKNRK